MLGVVEINITKLTESYILNFPSVKDALKKGLINYSSLARKIIKDKNLDKKSFDAILIACRRYYRKVKEEASNEEKILSILKSSNVEIKNKVAAIVLEKDIHMPNLLNIENKVKKQNKVFRNKIMKKSQDLVEITLKSPKEIETTAGVISYLYSLFGENNININ